MHYIFLETKDDGFLLRIADKVCPIIINKLIEDHNRVRNESGTIDNDLIAKYLNEEGKNLYPINCFYSLGSLCPNADCCANHETVFATHQAKLFSEKIESEYKNASKINKHREEFRLEIYRFYKAYFTEAKRRMKIIECKYDGKYAHWWNTYIDNVKNYMSNLGIQDLHYIRTDTIETNSDYSKFKNDTGYRHLLPCDNIRNAL